MSQIVTIFRALSKTSYTLWEYAILRRFACSLVQQFSWIHNIIGVEDILNCLHVGDF